MRGQSIEYDIRASAAFSCSSDEGVVGSPCVFFPPSSAFGTFSPRKKRGGRRRSMGRRSQKCVRNAG